MSLRVQRIELRNSVRNLIKSNQSQIVFTIYRLIWNQTNVCLVLNQWGNCKYNLISVRFNEISLNVQLFLSSCSCQFEFNLRIGVARITVSVLHLIRLSGKCFHIIIYISVVRQQVFFCTNSIVFQVIFVNCIWTSIQQIDSIQRNSILRNGCPSVWIPAAICRLHLDFNSLI